MTCSVIICTRNRALQLKEVLRSLRELEVPKDIAWELIIVDNGSSDDTSDVALSFADSLPVRLIPQPTLGLSNARNAGLAVALGEYIIWTDDDVAVHKQWLAAYIEAFRRWPDAAVFGGKVTPRLLPPTPAWFAAAQKDLYILLAARNFGATPLPLSEQFDRLPFGANFAIKSAHQSAHKFDPDLGVAPGRRRGGEETAVISKILAAGNSGWWVPDAEVVHLIPAERQTLQYVRDYYNGMGHAYAFSMLAQCQTWRAKAPVATWLKVALSFLRFQVMKLVGIPNWARYFASYSFHSGALKYFLTPPAERR